MYYQIMLDICPTSQFPLLFRFRSCTIRYCWISVPRLIFHHFSFQIMYHQILFDICPTSQFPLLLRFRSCWIFAPRLIFIYFSVSDHVLSDLVGYLSHVSISFTFPFQIMYYQILLDICPTSEFPLLFRFRSCTIRSFWISVPRLNFLCFSVSDLVGYLPHVSIFFTFPFQIMYHQILLDICPTFQFPLLFRFRSCTIRSCWISAPRLNFLYFSVSDHVLSDLVGYMPHVSFSFTFPFQIMYHQILLDICPTSHFPLLFRFRSCTIRSCWISVPPLIFLYFSVSDHVPSDLVGYLSHVSISFTLSFQIMYYQILLDICPTSHFPLLFCFRSCTIRSCPTSQCPLLFRFRSCTIRSCWISVPPLIFLYFSVSDHVPSDLVGYLPHVSISFTFPFQIMYHQIMLDICPTSQFPLLFLFRSCTIRSCWISAPRLNFLYFSFSVHVPSDLVGYLSHVSISFTFRFQIMYHQIMLDVCPTSLHLHLSLQLYNSLLTLPSLHQSVQEHHTWICSVITIIHQILSSCKLKEGVEGGRCHYYSLLKVS